MIRRRVIPALITCLLGAATGVAVAAAIRMPRVESLAQFTPSRITQFYDRLGEPFASYARQRRIVLRQDEVPQNLRQAVIAVEDSKFYQHGGFDAFGVIRAALSNLREGSHTEGASTLTMQLARTLFLSPEKKWKRKIEETFLAVELEKRYSKEELLTLYLNICFLGHGQYGVEAASRYFFGKPSSQLNLAEAATIAGIFQLPSRFSPYKNPEGTRQRRNHVLDRMLEEGYISRTDHAAAVAEPLTVVDHGPREEVGAYFSEEVRRYLEQTYGTTALLEHGLQVRTTLDPEIQESAEAALLRGLRRLDHRKGYRGPHQHLISNLEEQVLPSWSAQRVVADGWFEGIVLEVSRESARVKGPDGVHTLTPGGIAWTGKRSVTDILKPGNVCWFRFGDPDDEGGPPILLLEQEPQMQGTVIVLETATGAVRAMVGGWDFGRNQFNRATQAQRQVGSAFKLFVYGAALENGWTPADTIFDAPASFRGGDGKMSYSPRNYHGSYYGIVTLSRALEQSYNVSAVKLMDLVGVKKTIDLARRLGITSDLPPYPSLALGSADLIPMEVASAYAAVGNRGVWNQPYFIDSVRTADGDLLEQHQAKRRMAMQPETAFVLARMLEGVVDRGTARALSNLDLDIAGKTGTTNDYSNAWFCGFTPRYTIVVWVGYDQVRSLGSGMAGDKVAVPIWKMVAEDGLRRRWLATGERFTVPDSVTEVWVNRASGGRGSESAQGGVKMAFVPGTEPPEGGGSPTAAAGLPWYQQRAFYQARPGERMPEDFPAEELTGLAGTAATPEDDASEAPPDGRNE